MLPIDKGFERRLRYFVLKLITQTLTTLLPVILFRKVVGKRLQNKVRGNSLMLNTLSLMKTNTSSSRRVLAIRRQLLKCTVRGTRYRCSMLIKYNLE